jgi:glycine/D-amino acid oxidase-like deaminating enzyme
MPSDGFIMFRSASTHVDSYYAASSVKQQVEHPALADSTTADVCVVGAGFFGLYTAIELARAGKQVVVLEASRVGWGASGRNGGQMTVGFGYDMAKLASTLGESRTRHLFQASCEALRDIRRIVKDNGIDCDLIDGHLEVAVLKRRVPDLQHWVEACERRWGYADLQFVDKPELGQYLNSSRYQAGVLSPEGGHLHPLKYVLGLARTAQAMGVRIFEHTKADMIAEVTEHIDVQCGPLYVRCDQLVLAANAYVDQLDPHLASRALPVGTFMIATEPLGEARARALIPHNHAVFDNQFILEYFRTTADHRMLFGGKCSYLGGTPRDLKASMKRNMVRAFPSLADVNIDYAWGGHIDITMRRMPDWGRRDERIFWAQGFCGHGVVPTRVAAQIVADAVLGDPETLDAFSAIVNPPFPGGALMGGLMQAVGMTYYRLRDFL